VQGTLDQRDPEPPAQGVEGIGHAGKAGLGQLQRVDPARLGQFTEAAQAQFVVDEATVEGGVVGDQRRVADEIQKFCRHQPEHRSVAHLVVGDTVHPDGVRVDQPLGIDQAVKGPPRRHQVLKLEAADLDQPVTLTQVKAGGFGVEDDLASHGP
jgi:hypothetical protein